MKIGGRRTGSIHDIAGLNKYMDEYTLDEADRLKKAITKKDKFDHWLKKRIEEDERDIVHTPPLPKYVPSKVKWSETTKVGFRTAIRSLIP